MLSRQKLPRFFPKDLRSLCTAQGRVAMRVLIPIGICIFLFREKKSCHWIYGMSTLGRWNR